MAAASFRIVIVGGGIGGTVLALCLDRLGVDYILLEARDRLDPDSGASIGILPGGARILDQLGIFDSLAELTPPLTWAHMLLRGKPRPVSDFTYLVYRRTLYPFIFLPRQIFLQKLAGNIKDYSKVHVNKRVCAISSTQDEITVKCSDGSEYAGDVVIGADGVHSTVRRFVWEASHPSEGGKDESDSFLFAEYACHYGISRGVRGLVSGNTYLSYLDGNSTLVVHGKGEDAQTYWFNHIKMDKKYKGKEIPRFTRDDAEKMAARYADTPVSPTLTLADLWNTREVDNLAMLEEGFCKNWTFERLACLGDAVHKMTTSSGYGANSAIEDSAAIANEIRLMLQDGGQTKPSVNVVEKHLKRYQERREFRAEHIAKGSGDLTRLTTLEGRLSAIMAKIVPYFKHASADIGCTMLMGAEKLDFLPPPPRSLVSPMKWKPKGGVEEKSTLWWRVLAILPLLILCLAGTQRLDMIIKYSLDSESLYLGPTISQIGTKIPIGSSWFEHGVRKLHQTLTELHLRGRFSLLQPTDVLSFVTIQLVEAWRRGNMMSFATFPLLFFSLNGLWGIGCVSTVWMALHYVQNPPRKYEIADDRMLQVNAAKGLLETLVLGCLLWIVIIFPKLRGDDEEAKGRLLLLGFRLLPLMFGILHRIVIYFIPDNTRLFVLESDPFHRIDLPYLRATFAFVASACVISSNMASGLLKPLEDTPVLSWNRISSSFSDDADDNLVSTQLLKFGDTKPFLFIALFYWMVLVYADLKHRNNVHLSWFNLLVAFGAAGWIVGPASAVTLAWALREWLLEQ